MRFGVGAKLKVALPASRVLLPFDHRVTLAALRTRVGRRQLPVLRGVHGSTPWISDTMDPGVC